MARSRGGLSFFTIFVFVFVFGAMYQANEFAEDPDLPEDTANPTEKELRESILREVNDWRGSQALFPTQTTGQETIEAQRTAAALSNRTAFEGPVVAGMGYSDGEELPNPKFRCTQMGVAIPIQDGEITADGLTPAAADRVASASFEEILVVDDTGLLQRGVEAKTGVGVSVQNSTATVVYRTCLTEPASP